MLPPLHFGYSIAKIMEKQSGGVAGLGKALGGAIGTAAKAAPAKPVANAAQAGISSAPRWLQANQAAAAGRPALARELAVPAGKAPPIPAAQARKASPAPAAPAARPRGFEASGWFQ